MMADIPPNDTTEAIEHLPLRDVGRFVDARLQIGGENSQDKAGLTDVIKAIKPECGLFLLEHPNMAQSPCPWRFTTTISPEFSGSPSRRIVRRQGIGASIVNASLRWARLRGARTAWLAVESGNEAAIALYRKFGFRDVYRYAYRRAGA